MLEPGKGPSMDCMVPAPVLRLLEHNPSADVVLVSMTSFNLINKDLTMFLSWNSVSVLDVCYRMVSSNLPTSESLQG